MKIFLQPELYYDEDTECAEILQEHLEKEILKHSNIAEDCVEIVIFEAK